MKRGLFAGLALLLLTYAHANGVPVQEGDLIFQTSRSAQSLAIQRATGSEYSHMGVVFMRAGRPFVLEANATVRYTELEQWIDRGEGGRFVVKRLKDAKTLLTDEGKQKLRDVARSLEGRKYDLTFEWSDDRIYCSELAWKLFDRALGVHIGELQRLRDFNLSDPAVRSKLSERFGDRVPLDEPVISPVGMFRSPLLVTVTKR
jgi:hypothetical protein